MTMKNTWHNCVKCFIIMESDVKDLSTTDLIFRIIQ